MADTTKLGTDTSKRALLLVTSLTGFMMDKGNASTSRSRQKKVPRQMKHKRVTPQMDMGTIFPRANTKTVVTA